jgi:predicted enzyme related to lactoylglutathione lyase
MKIKKNVPLVMTDNLDGEKAFYCEHFGFRPTFDNGEYLGLVSEDGGCEISFMKPMCGQSTMLNNGSLVFCLEVDDVDKEHARLAAAGMEFRQAPKDNPWGDRSAIAIDPVGISVYIYKVIPPSSEFAKYFKE